MINKSPRYNHHQAFQPLKTTLKIPSAQWLLGVKTDGKLWRDGGIAGDCSIPLEWRMEGRASRLCFRVFSAKRWSEGLPGFLFSPLLLHEQEIQPVPLTSGGICSLFGYSPSSKRDSIGTRLTKKFDLLLHFALIIFAFSAERSLKNPNFPAWFLRGLAKSWLVHH